jgi:transposase
MVILFSDEAGFSLHPKLGRMWFKKGKKQPVIYTKSQHQKRVNVIGWVNPVDGQHGMIKCERGNTDSFLRFLKYIACRFKDKIVALWVDGPRWHKGKRVQIFQKENSHVNIHYIPPYHPKLNYQEILWRTLRYEETTNVYFENIEDLERAIFSRSRRWKPGKIQSLCHLI